jgi:clorobiocin biosynthesis protein CloN5
VASREDARSAELAQRLIHFIRNRFLAGDEAHELTVSTPLLDWGVLDSLRTIMLVNHIRVELGLPFPAEQVRPENLRTVEHVVLTIRAAEQASLQEPEALAD